MIFSGSAVVDFNNTSGFGTQGGSPPYIAIWTGFVYDPKTGTVLEQNQNLAFSTDPNGTHWTYYDKNPVLRIPGEINFRDPKVMWYDPGSRWIMAVSLSAE